MKKIGFASLAVCVIMLVVACGGERATSTASDAGDKDVTAVSTSAGSGDNTEAKSTNRRGQLIFKQYCVICHGADGKLGISGAKDLTISTLSKEERINQVTNGKGLMTPYKDILSAEQINAVVDYLEELR